MSDPAAKTPWHKNWAPIALGILFIGLAVSIGLPEAGRGIGNFFGSIGAGLRSFSENIENSKTGLFTIILVVAGFGGAIALIKYWNK